MHTIDEMCYPRRSNTAQINNVSRASHLMWEMKLEVRLPSLIRRLSGRLVGPVNRARRPRGPSFASRSLEAGCIVACLSIDAQRWEPLGGAQLDLDLAPSRVV
jgi:hypothetical protein